MVSFYYSNVYGRSLNLKTAFLIRRQVTAIGALLRLVVHLSYDVMPNLVVINRRTIQWDHCERVI